MADDLFRPWLQHWRLTPDGESIATRSSRLLPVRRGEEPAMLKIALNDEERQGAALMEWYAGSGAANVLALEDDALLLERASGKRVLAKMAKGGADDVATRFICETVLLLHGPRKAAPPETLTPLSTWFQELDSAASRHAGVLTKAAAMAAELLADQRDIGVLHGDIHHGNILDGARGWVAIDPKGLTGERTFDYANIFCNPDFETATAPDRLMRQADVVAKLAKLDRQRLLKWILSYAGLSAAWSYRDGERPKTALAVAELAAAQLAG
jgi:streptomycin 6-kinase